MKLARKLFNVAICAGSVIALNAMAARGEEASIAGCDMADFQQILRAEKTADAKLPAQAYWLNRTQIKWPGVAPAGNFKLYFSTDGQLNPAPIGSAMVGHVTAGSYLLDVFTGALAGSTKERFKFVPDGVVLSLRDTDALQLRSLMKRQLFLVQEDAAGQSLRQTRLQVAGALDDLYAAANEKTRLGVSIDSTGTQFALWAPTAQRVSLCIHANGVAKAERIVALTWDETTGIWSHQATSNLSDRYYTFLVDVFVPGVGLVRNRVTDPYSISLTTDSKRSYVATLSDSRLKPRHWDHHRLNDRVKSQTDMVIYELHVRDFSIGDMSVSTKHRGKYLAFTETNSHGMRHLASLSRAGITDVHLLPVFDFATVPERDCVTPEMPRTALTADGEQQQAIIAAVKERDCFNWGYDPLHYTAPEGSYATDSGDGARRILEFRQMVQALHGIGLRVGMDVVYNHTSASGQHEFSVLDRIVPGYYQRLNADGAVETSTCCANTATENAMMAKLMIDSVVTWARDYRIDSFRFDLMGHQPRSVMVQLQEKLRHLRHGLGRNIPLIGEGWNFGEVENGKRFAQASQLSLNDTAIGTFSDRARDAVRGGGPAENGERLVTAKGFINGLHVGAKSDATPADKGALLRAADMVRVGLAGSLRDYPLTIHTGQTVPLSAIDYNGQPSGYVAEPSEVVNYVENHDNQTLFDINVYKLPADTNADERVRVQMLGNAITALSQGIAYFHAGTEILRSKSMDRNSFDSGDWFNRIDWTGRQNFFGTGMPPKQDNQKEYDIIRSLLANTAIQPSPRDIAWTRNVFNDLLRIRASSNLFRLRTADDVKSRLSFFNTGLNQVPAVVAAHIDGRGYAGAGYQAIVFAINVDIVARAVTLPAVAGEKFRLHPVQQSARAADKRVQREARFDRASGAFHVPARSAVVFVRD